VLPECATPTRRWLVRHGRIDEAKKSLLRLTSARATADFDADETVALMQHTIRLENEVTAGSTYAECFRGSIVDAPRYHVWRSSARTFVRRCGTLRV